MEKKDIIPNQIYYTTNLEILAEVVEKNERIKNSDFLKSEFLKSLISYAINKNGIVLVSFNEEKKLNGCVVLSRHLDEQGEYIFFDFRWLDPANYKELMHKYYNEVIGTAKVRGIKRIQGTAGRCFRVAEKYYHAHEISRNFEINVEEAEMKDDNEA